MKVCLINVPFFPKGSPLLLKPQGLLYIASYLHEKGEDVLVLDYYQLRKSDYKTEIISRRLAEYDVIGLSTYQDNFQSAIELVNEIKLIGFNGKIVLGGPFPSIEYMNIMKLYPQIDFIIRGEGEVPLYMLTQYLKNIISIRNVPNLVFRDEEACINENPVSSISCLDSLPFPDFKISYHPEYSKLTFFDRAESKLHNSLMIVSSRGCPFKCNFCVISKVANIWRSRSPENVMDEIDFWQHKETFSHVMFMDANFFLNPRRALEIADKLHKKKLIFGFSSTIRALIKNEKLIPELYKFGLRVVDCGVENANDYLTKNELGRDHTVQESLHIMECLKKYNILPVIEFIMFTPETTIEHVKNNIDFLNRIDYLWEDKFRPLFNSLILYSGIQCKENVERKLNIKMDHIKLYDIEKTFTEQKTRLLYQVMVNNFESQYLDTIICQMEDIVCISEELKNRHERNEHSDLKKLQELRLNYISLRYIPAKLIKRTIHILIDMHTDFNEGLVSEITKQIYTNLVDRMHLHDFLQLNSEMIQYFKYKLENELL